MAIINWKYAFAYGGLLWMLSFIEVSFIISITALQQMPLVQDCIYLVILAVIASFCAHLYFHHKPKPKEGIVLGLVFVVATIVLDLIVTVPVYVHNYNYYFGDIQQWLSFLVIFAICALKGDRKI